MHFTVEKMISKNIKLKKACFDCVCVNVLCKEFVVGDKRDEKGSNFD